MDGVEVAHVRAWAHRTAEVLAAARERLDAANLFPVPDHDTGTNLALTARVAAEALATDAAADVATALRRFATGAVRAARGNSGVILSQVLRGFADAGAVPGADLAAGYRAADTAARAAVADPVEGTMLTVTRVAADAAATAGTGTAAAVAAAAARAGRERLRTLAAPGGTGVDAGAEGLVLVHEALAAVLAGDPPPLDAAAPTVVAPTVVAPGAVSSGAGPLTSGHTGTPGGPAYEVQYLLDLPPGVDAPAVVHRLAETLRPLGDSLVLADDGEGLWAVHVHVDDIGAAVEAGAVAVARGGAMSQVRVTRFDLDTGGTDHAGPGPSAVSGRPGAGEGVTPGRPAAVVASGADLAPARVAFAPLPVTVLGPGEDFPSGELVVVAIGEAATTAAMRHADGSAGVTVVPARAIVQALAAVAVHDPGRRGVDDTVAMAEAAAGCRPASLTVAETGGLTIVGVAEPGDVLGLVGEEVAVVGRDHVEVGRTLLERLLAAGGELVTVLHPTARAELAAALAGHVRDLGDHLDVEVRDVGPDLSVDVLLGVE